MPWPAYQVMQLPSLLKLLPPLAPVFINLLGSGCLYVCYSLFCRLLCCFNSRASKIQRLLKLPNLLSCLPLSLQTAFVMVTSCSNRPFKRFTGPC